MDRNLSNMQRPRERGTETQKWGWVGVAERERDRQAGSEDIEIPSRQ